MPIESYQDLDVWKKSMTAVELIYRYTSAFPATEKYGLISQMCRASVSIPANIAEGYGRKHVKEYVHHLAMAKGSLFELETLIIISARLEFLKRDQVTTLERLLADIRMMLYRLIRSLRRSD